MTRRRDTGQNGPSTGRRGFLKGAAAAIAAPTIITSSALGAGGRPPASERIVMGGIGLGNQGSNDQRAFLNRDGVQYVAVCDVRQEYLDSGKQRVDDHYGNGDCTAYHDFRELLARDDIDAIHTACPDHWHAIITIQACRHGKDVYCQKPLARTVRGGRAMVQAARRYNRVVSGGSQRVLNDYRSLHQETWGGQLGKLKEIYVNVGGPSKRCNLPGKPVPDGIDWDMWLGPAPWEPYHPYRISGSYSIDGTSWRSWWDYSGGGMTDWGAHKFAAAMFTANVHHTGPTEVIPPDEDHEYLTYVFDNGLRMYHSPGRGDVEVVGSDEPRPEWPAMPTYKGDGGIYGDWLHCVRTRQRPFRDVEISHRASTVCQLGLIAYELQRPIEWDPDREVCPNDAAANRMLDRARREPWSL